MSIRYLTVTHFAQVLEVSFLRDAFDKPTQDPALAERCILHFPNGDMIAAMTDECPVYTVH
jgi:hypothetical protein